MRNNIEITYSTSNKGKYDFLKRIIHKMDNVKFNWLDSKMLNLNETNDSKLNARIKAIEVSKIRKSLILSSDDSLFFLGTEELIQPGANIYRNISPSRDINEIILHYSNILENCLNKSINAKLITYYALAKNGFIINEFMYSYDMILKMPKNLKHVEEMPLSIFHYIENRDMFYPELVQNEKNDFHKNLLHIFNLMVLNLSMSTKYNTLNSEM